MSLSPSSCLDAWIAQPDPLLLSPAALRLARQVPALRPTLADILTAPLDRSLAGLGPPPAESDTLADAVLSAQARVDGGALLPPAEAAALEERARGDARWWVPAARLHVLSCPARARQARMALSQMDLPFVLPGELHPMAVELLAIADRALPSLHVDWARKLSAWSTDTLLLDLRHLGLWFWPHLRFLDERKIQRPLQRLARKRLPPGGRGLVRVYQWQVSGTGLHDLTDLPPADRLIASLAASGQTAGGGTVADGGDR